MALGTKYRRVGRKQDLIMRIKLQRSFHGMNIPDVLKSVKGYSKKSVDELIQILKEERE